MQSQLLAIDTDTVVPRPQMPVALYGLGLLTSKPSFNYGLSEPLGINGADSI